MSSGRRGGREGGIFDGARDDGRSADGQRTATTGVSHVPWLRIFNTRSSPAANTQIWTGRRRVQVVRGYQSDPGGRLRELVGF